jgi:hypothetical protein
VTVVDDASAVVRRRRALTAAGLDPDPDLTVIGGPSFANEVWIGDELVIRINHAGQIGGDSERILREAAIAAKLPREARYPDIVDAGRDGNLDGIVTRPAWRSAELGLRQLARVRACNRRARGGARRGARGGHRRTRRVRDRAGPHAAARADRRGDRRGRRSRLARRRRCGGPRAVGRVRRHEARLVHGDPHLENALWDGTRLSALLDLE